MDSRPVQTPPSTDSANLDEHGVDPTTEDRADAPEASMADTSLTLTDVLTIISNRRRRFILHYLQQSGPAATLGELSTQIAAWELGKPVEVVSSAERKNVYNALAKTHVRRLREHGFVHEQRDGIELTDQAQSIRIHVDIVPDRDVLWSQYYIYLGAFILAISAVFAFLTPAVVPVGGVGIFAAVSLLGSAVAHWYYKRRMCIGTSELPPELRYDE